MMSAKVSPTALPAALGESRATGDRPAHTSPTTASSSRMGAAVNSQVPQLSTYTTLASRRRDAKVFISNSSEKATSPTSTQDSGSSSTSTRMAQRYSSTGPSVTSV